MFEIDFCSDGCVSTSPAKHYPELRRKRLTLERRKRLSRALSWAMKTMCGLESFALILGTLVLLFSLSACC